MLGGREKPIVANGSPALGTRLHGSGGDDFLVLAASLHDGSWWQLFPMRFCLYSSVNMDGPVLARQSAVGWRVFAVGFSAEIASKNSENCSPVPGLVRNVACQEFDSGALLPANETRDWSCGPGLGRNGLVAMMNIHDLPWACSQVPCHSTSDFCSFHDSM